MMRPMSPMGASMPAGMTYGAGAVMPMSMNGTVTQMPMSPTNAITPMPLQASQVGYPVQGMQSMQMMNGMQGGMIMAPGMQGQPGYPGQVVPQHHLNQEQIEERKTDTLEATRQAFTDAKTAHDEHCAAQQKLIEADAVRQIKLQTAQIEGKRDAEICELERQHAQATLELTRTADQRMHQLYEQARDLTVQAQSADFQRKMQQALHKNLTKKTASKDDKKAAKDDKKVAPKDDKKAPKDDKKKAPKDDKKKAPKTPK